MAGLDPKILADVKRDRLLIEGHFAYRSGRHAGVLLDRDRMLTDPVAASHMGYALAKRFFTDHLETIAAPSIWGAGLAQWVAYFLEPKAKVVYATPKDGVPTVAEALNDLVRDKRVLLIDNLVISGATMTHFTRIIEGLGGTVIGLGTLWNASNEQIAGRDVFGLLNPLYRAYDSDDCPLCAAGSESTAIPY